MAGTGSSGNPNIIRDTQGKKTGPTTLGGKLKVSLNSSKSLSTSTEINAAMEELGVRFEKTEDALTIKKIFKEWFLSKTGKELTEIDRLGELINILEADTAVRTMDKLEKGIPLDDSDLKLIKLLKETLEATHKLKFGTKQVNIHGDFDDIRKMMFDDNP
ncbi:hypothetical protein LCGC14_0948500 [marine sediment metagenome]|uniref:Uncharacterized protein n=1 Tax=marine sediment metagenome TaxID=412755 RepID=A0A0F9NMQ5_9ZZZZ